jgi:hypothetical protein
MRWSSIARAVSTLVAVALYGACGNPYGTFQDPDQSLGPVDPVLFPPTNMGQGGDRKRPGRGRFSEITAYVDGAPVGYFSYPLSTGTGTDPLRVLEQGQPIEGVPTPAAYVFDVDHDPCSPPPDYQYIVQRDAVDYSKQGAVFTTLPQATYAEGALPTTKYVPVVAEARMVAPGLPCQELKSVKRIKDVVGMVPPVTGKYLAWLIIDPAAPVYPHDNPTGVLPGNQMLPGIGLQRWGWYNRYLLAYLDGGYIPTEEATVMGMTVDGPGLIKIMRLHAQKLFVPRQIKTDTGMAAGKAGAGYDVLDAKRGTDGYSPVCQLWSYGDPAMPMAPADLPKSAADIMNAPGLNPAAASPASYTFCLQVR